MNINNYKFETKQLHAGQENADTATGARCVPIYQTASYVFKDCDEAEARFGLTQGGNIYARLMNPTTTAFEERITALEGGVASLATSSGAAAVTYAIQNIARAGDHVVSSNTLYGGTYNLFAHTLKDFGIETTFVDPLIISNFEKAIKNNTKLIFVESLGNPNSTPVDIAEIAKVARKNGLPLVVDNTLASPYLFRPIEHGANVVVHSATKFIGGHGTTLGGVIVDGGNFDWKANDKFPSLSKPDDSYHGIVFADACGKSAFATRTRTTLMRDTGACLSPFNSFLLLQGLETLSLRVERHVQNALSVVKFLHNHNKVEKVNHPSVSNTVEKDIYNKYYPLGAGSIFTFDIIGDVNTAKSFINNLKLFSLLANIADSKSLVIHPASTTHSQMTDSEQQSCGIKKTTIRLSIGTEHIDDIISDLAQALEKI